MSVPALLVIIVITATTHCHLLISVSPDTVTNWLGTGKCYENATKTIHRGFPSQQVRNLYENIKMFYLEKISHEERSCKIRFAQEMN